jgi:serine/threonine protein kinase
VKSYGWYEDGDSLCIAMEYLKLGDLQQSISMMPPLEEKDVTTITLQILEGLYFMHDNDFAHRDMKPKVNCRTTHATLS